eukprot:gene25170-33693_t
MSNPQTTPSHLKESDDVTTCGIDTEIAARKLHFPIILKTHLKESCSTTNILPQLRPLAYTVVGGELVATSTSPTAVYEGIIAKYRQQRQHQHLQNSRPSSAIKTKKASALKSLTPLANPIHKTSPKKPAFFVRRSDALSEMQPAMTKHGSVRIDEDNKVDLDLEIFASMMKQAKVVSAEPAATSAEKARRNTSMMQSFSSVGNFNSSGSFLEPIETRASLESRIGKKMMSAMPKYDMLFLPATSAPFLPKKTKRISQIGSPNNILDAIAAVGAQSSDNEMARPEPYYSKRMDVIVIVEHCCDCEQHCTQSLRHDPKKYVQMANDVLYSIIDFISSSAVGGSSGDDHYPVRLFCMRTKPLTPDRIGAFEVTVAVNITPPMQPSSAASTGTKRGSPSSFLRRSDAPHLRQYSILEEDEQPVVDSLWATHLIYSKLQTKSWPSVQAIQKKMEQFLSAVLNGERVHHYFHSTIQQRSAVLQTDDEGHVLSEEEILKEQMAAKVRAIEDSYSKWVDRMRIPLKVEKHNLDLEWPDSAMGKRAIPSEKKRALPSDLKPLSLGGRSDYSDDIEHPLGPYVDFKLLDKISTSRFDAAVLRHFEVLNTT